MQIIADLQLHSKHSRAVSHKMDLDEIARWSSKKGINLVATGDWTHPLWFREIKAKLKEVSPGIFSLNEDKTDLPVSSDVRFLLSTEISSIYSQGGKVRRVHNLIFSPSIATCEKIIKEMRGRGANLMSDGRPIVGIPSKDLLEMVLTIDKNVLFVPAHVWTPWFSLYGSKSGFDSIEECFGNLSNNIYAIETGLSSDPIMNWQIKELETRSIISSSDAHSGPKLGREATVFTTVNHQQSTINNFSYQDITDAIKQISNSKLKIGYTIEFFPEEGKYHWSGHRACNIRYSPRQVKEKGGICPVCRQPLTIGVENRVMDLSYKTLGQDDLLYLKNGLGVTFVYDKNKKRVPFVSLIPLQEVLVEINNGSPIRAFRQYEQLTSAFATEFEILLKKTYAEIETAAGSQLKKAVQIIRDRRVHVDPGYDGVFGVVKLIGKDEKTDSEEKKSENQPSLF
ncbi:hypothetical protein A2774_01205 [Candidatus Roizmanbacteria bacterium RIFCSPHIGHO2_01_FULL_39_12c]|uniref:DNA helicase UvrD n=1 Tax=Candidatus Roizmanbacteria bacterium RIFCSPHIGHO2_01_FULL_39_12c TaxID=1802031 RepID=A0A1F7G8F4_9BACT|nr:MAG: hypothetical protein A2774_01205 [Candidatus Roizmanbacteria bacterium RIFCSPHIGHO2_01_FULL_39_12c]OGK46446.1 MAG: hypothetical protein A2963_01610 [Candidatus Roizmanbacteria bacterium RIFCSPLOWO2_01_FULL_40_13]